jgi:hypothetical protein
MPCYIVFTYRSLQIFLYATERISQSKTPLVHEVILIFDSITQVLDNSIGDYTLPPVVCVAAA